MWNLVSYRWVNRKPCSLTLHLRPISVSLSFPWSHLCVASISLGLSFVFLTLFHYSVFSSVSRSVVSDSLRPYWLWTVANKAPLSMGFSRREYWSGLTCSPPGDLPDPGIQPGFSPLQTFFTNWATREVQYFIMLTLKFSGNRICYFYDLGIPSHHDFKSTP